MAYVIAICGAGGKTTLCENLAKKYADENKKVCIITTTHMWAYDDVINVDDAYKSEYKSGQIYTFGKLDRDSEKIEYVGDDIYKELCDEFDYIIVEADGSKSMPLKIPYGIDGDKIEPVIPLNVNEIIIVVGLQSIGREIGSVCHRFDEFYGKDEYLTNNNINHQTIVTNDLIDNFVNHYYYESLKNKFPNVDIKIYKNDFANAGFEKAGVIKNIKVKKLCLSLCASGFSKRFENGNKLFSTIPLDSISKLTSEDINNSKSNDNKLLYELMIDKLLSAKEIIEDKFVKNLNYRDLKIDISVVTQYDEIINDDKYIDKVIMIKNNNADNGLSSSIKLTIDKFYDYDAVVFINADLPLLKTSEITNFVYQSVLNNSGIASMYTDKPMNPAYFEKEYFDEILKISGDTGPKELFKKYKKELYKYHIDKKYLFDIDTVSDLEKLKKM